MDKSMTGEIVSFKCFLTINKHDIFGFDIILGTCIRKSEMGKRCVVLSCKVTYVLMNCTHEFVSEHEILNHWRKMKELKKKIPI